MAEAVFEVFRGTREVGQPATYRVPIAPGMVVLDALHHIQAHQAPDLAVRWNCKAGKCGSCSAEVNGRPRLTCKTRVDALPLDKPITVHPMKSFAVIKDLVTDVSWNYRVNKKIAPFEPRPGTDWKMYQDDADRVQEFRKCIECFLCQNVCHVLRDHEQLEHFGGPRFFVRVAALEMHPLDSKSRAQVLKDDLGIGLCNITKCCTEVCHAGAKDSRGKASRDKTKGERIAIGANKNRADCTRRSHGVQAEDDFKGRYSRSHLESRALPFTERT